MQLLASIDALEMLSFAIRATAARTANAPVKLALVQHANRLRAKRASHKSQTFDFFYFITIDAVTLTIVLNR